MKKLAIAALALGAVMSSFATTPASAAEPAGPGLLCGFSSITDPSVEDGTQTGTIDAGPLSLVDPADPTTVHTGNFICTIQVNASTHAGADAAKVTGPSTPAVIALPETQVSYVADADDTVYLCTEVVVDGQHYYWDDANDPNPATDTSDWSTSTSARCGVAISASTPGEDEPPFDTINPILDGLFDLLNATVCPVLATVDTTLGLGTTLQDIWGDCY